MPDCVRCKRFYPERNKTGHCPECWSIHEKVLDTINYYLGTDIDEDTQYHLTSDLLDIIFTFKLSEAK